MARSGSYVPFQDEIMGIGYREKLAQKVLVWDNASTHGAIKVTSGKKQSFWHNHATKLGLRGVVFLPPRTPSLNPIELLFGYLKRYLRKKCPDDGYTQTTLLQTIQDGFRLVRPDMVANWIKKCGYRLESAAEIVAQQQAIAVAAAEQREAERTIICEEAAAMDPSDAIEPVLILENADQHLSAAQPMEIDTDGVHVKSELIAPDSVAQQEVGVAAAAAHAVLSVAEPNHAVASPAVAQPSVCYTDPGLKFPRKASVVCMDVQGTVRRKKIQGQTTFNRALDRSLTLHSDWKHDVAMVDATAALSKAVQQLPNASDRGHIPEAATAASKRPMDEGQAFRGVGVTRRWAGIGPHPKGLREQLPRSVFNSRDESLAEIDGIIEHRQDKGSYQYLVRYKGWEEEWDEWLSEGALETAPGAIKEYWARKAMSS